MYNTIGQLVIGMQRFAYWSPLPPFPRPAEVAATAAAAEYEEVAFSHTQVLINFSYFL